MRGYPASSIQDLAKELGLSPRDVRSILKEAGRLPARSFRMPLMTVVLILAVAALGGLIYHMLTRPGTGRLALVRERLNLLVVTIDTCRADRLGCYGYEKAFTPFTDSVAASGVLFERAYAHQPITLPSHATIFTGTHPAYHGVDDNGLFMLPGEAVTLAEVLRERGFTTGAVISAFVLHRQFGLDQGFDWYDDRLAENRRTGAPGGYDEIPATIVSDRGVNWIRQNAKKQWFLWLHYFDPHFDYKPPSQFSKITSQPYDGEIAYVDSEMRRIIETLEQEGIREQTLLVITSDHGEGLGEHGDLTHGKFLYETTAWVPLIFSLPGLLPEGRVTSRLVSLMDLMPTILDVLGIPIPGAVQGRSLLPLLFSDPGDWTDKPVLMETKYPWYQHGWSPSYAIRQDDYKFIKAPKPELYDISRDPHELKNLYEVERGRAGAMAGILEEVRAEYAASSIAREGLRQMDDETRDRLTSLGYVFSGGADKEVSPDAPDVKDMAEVISLSARALKLKSSGDYEQAIALLEDVIRKNPGNRRVLNQLGVWNAERGRYDEAERYLKMLVSMDPDFIPGYDNLGQLYAITGRFEKAQAMADAVLSRLPDSAMGHNILGMIRMNKKEYREAIPYFEKAIELYPIYQDAHANLGACYYGLKEYEKASEAYSTALRLAPNNQNYRNVLEKIAEETENSK